MAGEDFRPLIDRVKYGPDQQCDHKRAPDGRPRERLQQRLPPRRHAQKLSGTTSRTPGSSCSCWATPDVIGSSTATKATASPASLRRPRPNVAMLIRFSPSLVPSAPMKPGASVLTI